MSPDAPTPDDQATTDVPLLGGRYQVLGQLGRGGMGTVFRARDAKLERPVALKMLPEGTAPDAGAVARFRREARALARLSHPGIIQAYDSGQDGGKHFLVMELVEGHSLAALLRDPGRVSPARAADFAYQAALALQHAHQSGLVHRDVKPSNLLLSSDGRVRLLDLGLARFLQDQIGEAQLTRTGTGMGTPDYCPPEQFRDARQADARSDVYSLGCTLYHLIGGRVPFPGSSFSEKVEGHETKEPAPLEELCPEAPVGLALAVRRMMAKRPADRFASMTEVAEALMPHVAGSSASSPEIRNSATWDGSRLATTPAAPRRRRLVTWAGAAAAVLLLAGVVGLVGFAAGWFRPGAAQVAQLPDAQPEGTPKTVAPGDAPPALATADNPDVLTVSQKKEGGGKYRSIGEALENVKSGQTIRIVDAAVYHERLTIGSALSHRDITLEATGGAILEMREDRASMIVITGVPGVTLRGLRLTSAAHMATLVTVQGDSSGTTLEDLQLDTAGETYNGVEVCGCPGTKLARPLTIRGCTIKRPMNGLIVFGTSFGYKAGPPVDNIVVRDNLISSPNTGIWVLGEVRRLACVGNRVYQARQAGIQLEQLLPGTEKVFVADNTFLDCAVGLRVWDAEARGKEITVRNNLFLASSRADMFFIDSGGHPTEARGPGDGEALARAWTIGQNWREAPPGGTSTGDERGRIPSPNDIVRPSIDGVSRDPKSPDFLRPAKGSPLATGGAGKEDPSLPNYAGALPPEGTEPWDWDRAWRMPKDAQLLTVSKESSGGGKYRAINDALKEAKPWATVRVLDAGEYAEVLKIDDKGRHEGLCLEAIRGAALVGGHIEPMLTVADVPNVRVRGFHFRGDETPRQGLVPLVLANGAVPGLVLEGLELTSPAKKEGAFAIGVLLQDVQVSPTEAPAVVRRCTIRVGHDGVHVASKFAGCSGVRVEQNYVQARRGIWVGGKVHRVQVAGNRILDCEQSGLQIENLDPSSGQILMANNTVGRGNIGFRYWLNENADVPVDGQSEVRNNLLFEATVIDMGFERDMDGKFTPGNHRALSRLWRFGYNGRDLSGNDEPYRLLPEPTDQRFDKAPLVSLKPTGAGFLRPAKDSPLATKGAGAIDPSLPVYIGAVPPEGVEPWDWDRTWRVRVKKTEEKSDGPAGRAPIA